MNGANILVVDDNALNRKIIATIALHQGHTVEQAAGGCLLYTSPSPRD